MIISNHFKQRTLIVLITIIIFASCTLLAQKSVLSQKLNVKSVVIDPRSNVEIRPVMLDMNKAYGKTFSQIAGSLHPYAAINGTFYDANLKPLGDILINGKLVNKGKYPNAIAVKNNGKIEFVRRDGDRFL